LSIDPLLLAAILTAGLVLGAVCGWLVAQPARAQLRSERDRDRALHTSELERERAVHAERLRAYQDAESKLRDTFTALSNEALKNNNEQFLSLAQTRLERSRTEAAADIESRKKAIEDLISPMAKTLEHMDREVRESERRRIEAGATLMEKMTALDQMGQDLRSQTQRLVDALKRPGVRGRWGELQLKRVVELAGMLEHCHFTEQETLASENGRIRPDVLINLPGGKHIIVDAKVPLDAYLRALEAPDDDVRQKLLADHARQVRTHMLQLSAKSYYDKVSTTPEFVVMFLPGEMFFSAALEQDPALIEFGVDKRVIPASPTTLIALLRAVAYGWQQEAMEENARKISDLGKGLYESVRVLGTHFANLGGRLQASLEAYNQAVGSLEGNVLIKARKFRELQAANGGEEIKALEPIDRVPRMLQAPELTDGLPFDAEDIEEADNIAHAGKV
jgi:DNA recombination protein RmuC